MKDNRAASADAPRPLDLTSARDNSRDAANSEDALGPISSLEPDHDTHTANGGAADLSGLSIAGLTRRRAGWVAAAFVSVWIVVVFARQVGDATAASNRALQMAADNAALAAEVEDLQDELALIVGPEFVGQQARGQGFGASREIAFSLDPALPSPADGAPGSASLRLGADDVRQTPLEAWLSLLFGPGD